MARDEALEAEKNGQFVQQTEENPRALAPNDIQPFDFALEEPATIPALNVSEIPVIPPTISSSNWARRNARVQKAKRVLPEDFCIFMAYVLVLVYVV